MSRKFIVVTTFSKLSDRIEIMHMLMDKFEEHNIEIIKHTMYPPTIETNNVIIRLVSANANVKGLRCDEVFGTFNDSRSKEYLIDRRLDPSVQPYEGTLVSYILEKEHKEEK